VAEHPAHDVRARHDADQRPSSLDDEDVVSIIDAAWAMHIETLRIERATPLQPHR
jgi:hypothetical protein